MRIEEKPSEFRIEVRPLHADQRFTYYDKRAKEMRPASWIDETPFWNKHHCLVYSGAAGSGKTTTSLSLISSTRKKSKVYAGVFDTVLCCAPISTLKSLVENPFDSLDPDQVYHTFNEAFLDDVLEICEEKSMMDKDTLVWIDDAANSLKSNRRVIDKLTNLVCKHRHLRCSIHLLIQDLIQLPLSIRENISGSITFKPINAKRMKLFHEEYLSELTYAEFLKLQDYLYRSKGDFLFIKNEIPRAYYRNFDRIYFQSSSKHGIENKEDEISEKS